MSPSRRFQPDRSSAHRSAHRYGTRTDLEGPLSGDYEQKRKYVTNPFLAFSLFFLHSCSMVFHFVVTVCFLFFGSLARFVLFVYVFLCVFC